MLKYWFLLVMFPPLPHDLAHDTFTYCVLLKKIVFILKSSFQDNKTKGHASLSVIPPVHSGLYFIDVKWPLQDII